MNCLPGKPWDYEKKALRTLPITHTKSVQKWFEEDYKEVKMMIWPTNVLIEKLWDVIENQVQTMDGFISCLSHFGARYHRISSTVFCLSYFGETKRICAILFQ